jgi:acetolactate synthase-1/2/3 large subunit
MHEQAASFMAEGYAKVKGFGIAMATSGPGGLNMVTGIANCFYDSVPVLFITGQVQTRFIHQDPQLRQLGFQETDIVSIVKPITKYAKLVVDNFESHVENAISLARNGRPGPCLLDIPGDIQKAASRA